jgi:hypothetical protein
MRKQGFRGFSVHVQTESTPVIADSITCLPAERTIGRTRFKTKALQLGLNSTDPLRVRWWPCRGGAAVCVSAFGVAALGASVTGAAGTGVGGAGGASGGAGGAGGRVR